MFDNSDDFDFNPSSSSKLASLFDNSIVPNDLNSSLTYTAPKQPKSKRESLNEVQSKPQTSVLLAKVVSLWKLENKDYKTLGKHGLALIGSPDLNLYEIIAYKEKTNIILRRKVNDNCSFYNQKDSFSSFYDDRMENWLVKFDSIDDQSKFCEELLNRGARIVNNMEETPQKKEKTPSDTSKESLPTKSDKQPNLLQSKEQDVEEINSDSSGSQKRANILSRMAKMGQQILPNQILKNTSTDVSDSELDSSKLEHKAHPRKFKRSPHNEKNVPTQAQEAPQQTYLENKMVPTHSHNSSYPVQFPQNMVSPMFYNQPVAYDGFNQYIAAQNAELKINLAQISAKLDCVLSGNSTYQGKFEERTLQSKIKALELQSENLQSELQRYQERNYDLQEKYDDLQERSKPVENKENKAVIQKLKEEVGKLNLDLKTAEQKNIASEKLEIELETYKNNIKDLEETIEIQNLKLKEFEKLLEENNGNKSLQSTIDSLNETVSTLNLKLKNHEEYFLKTEAEKQNHIEESKKIINNFNDKVKDHMNSMYQSILTNFNEDSSYCISEIKSIVAQNLKGTTFKIIKDFMDIYENEGSKIVNESQN